ncbi:MULTISPECIES: NAD(P)-dependent oxidoreductase [Marinomonas]|uniref:NAD(P)-dependent oxidoreductase n=1 Tax=Marinomonas arctica TaxID=383750 RepID=A0A7H1J1M6_9GAMM|nr:MULTISPECIES: NAD(P)-dependent oxidoreductase [Marinomonas]MCS7488064.1 3-hydroxyisobutyrate dehydrogenase [Marinomonas sp. BSi20414]QNT04392.1 NAD(P)-dependent oxidoreductase [Marinomonas arctica]GGN31640.1 3-hydroxyisobutyrate dehydrogenase [Marinomonas arctica]
MKSIGFLGLGIMGKAMAANLIKAGFDVTVWNRNAAKCAELVALGARQGATPKDVAAHCDITFAMVSDPEAALALCQGPDGVAAGIGAGRGYVDMSTVDDITSKTIASLITHTGGRFLEAPVSGTKKPAEDGTLIILAAGDPSLYEDAKPAFEVMGKMSPYLGDVGQGANMKLVVNMMMGGMLSIFSEGLSLGQKAGLDGQQILDIIDAGAMSNPMFKGKGAMLLNENYTTSFPLKHMQKDMRLAVALGDQLDQPLPTAAIANEAFKQAIKAGFGEEDMAAVYKVIK